MKRVWLLWTISSSNFLGMVIVALRGFNTPKRKSNPNTPVRPDGDHPRPYGDQKMYKVAGKREHNARKSLKKLQT